MQQLTPTKKPQSSNPRDVRTYERYPGNTVSQTDWKYNDSQMVYIQPDGNAVAPFLIDRYEATIADRVAWSMPEQRPTTRLLYKEAQEACHNAGKRLCTTNEWQVACRGGRTLPYYYRNTGALKEYCDFARSNGYDHEGEPSKTNSHPQCKTRQGVHHMIGNLAEMTTGSRGGVVIMGMTYYDQHYKDPDNALRQACEHHVFSEGQYSQSRYNEGIGFRCCKPVSITRAR